MSNTSAPTAHKWTFFRSGGFDQVRISTGADIAAIPNLNLKLWTALACPVKGLEFDERTLAILDTDKDGRVRAPEIIAAIEFAKASVKDLGGMIPGSATLPLSAIDDATPAGQALVAVAKRILTAAGKPTAAAVTAADIDAVLASIAKTQFNGDGVIPPAAADDADTRQTISDIIATHGGVMDRGGDLGITAEKIAAFYPDLVAFDAWWKQAENPAAGLWPLGTGTLAGMAALDAVQAKVDDFFTRCRLAAFDPRAETALNRIEEDYLKIAASDLAITSHEVAGFPLSRVAASAALPLGGALNPAWSGRIAAFADTVVRPLLGAEKTSVSEAEWTALSARFTATRGWLATKTGIAVEKLGIARVRELLSDDSRARVGVLIAKDQAVAAEFDAIAPLEKLVHLYRDLYRLLHNFVNFADFYSPERLATFQAGTLYLDSRACELVVRVDDGAKHAALAGLAKSYLAYCDCVNAGGQKMTIAAAYTAGDSDYLMVGRNGLFFDRKGRDWDATITKIIDNPISIRQAFWAPYKKAIRFVEETIAKRAAAADDAATAKLTTGVEAAAKAAEAGKAPKENPKLDVGVIAALGVGVGAIGGVLGGMLSGFISLGWWMPVGLLGLMLGISLPSMIIAALKLRQRNLGPILDANGWAVNGRVKINIPFGGSLTALPKLPANATRLLTDPYAEKKRPWKWYIALLLVLGASGWLTWDWYSHGKKWIWGKRTPVSSSDAPKADAPAAPAVTPPPAAK